MRSVYEFLFVRKDPRLMAMPYRKTIGLALIAVGTIHIIVGLFYLTGVVS